MFIERINPLTKNQHSASEPDFEHSNIGRFWSEKFDYY